MTWASYLVSQKTKVESNKGEKFASWAHTFIAKAKVEEAKDQSGADVERLQ